MIEAKDIGTIVSILVLIGIAIFIVSMLSVQDDLNPATYNRTFNVTDSSINQSFNIGNPYLQNVRAEKWNGVEWESINDIYVNYVGSDVKINHEGLD